MNQNNFIRNNFGKNTLIEINFNFFRSPEGPKSKLPIKRLLALVMAAITWLTNGVQAPVIARPTVEIVTPAPGSTFTVGSTVSIAARATTPTAVNRIEFFANGRGLCKTDTQAQ
jgi:hypothetical protein